MWDLGRGATAGAGGEALVIQPQQVIHSSRLVEIPQNPPKFVPPSFIFRPTGEHHAFWAESALLRFVADYINGVFTGFAVLSRRTSPEGPENNITISMRSNGSGA
jgi:hypothetical protein